MGLPSTRMRACGMSTLTFTCQECNKTGTDRTDFKQVDVRSGPLRFAYILCNEHAKKHETESTDD